MQPQQPYQPQFPAQPMAPQYPQQGYPVQPAYPAAPPMPAPVTPQYPQQYGQPIPAYPGVAAAQSPMPAGTLDGFFNQPSSGGGPSFKFNNKPIGTSYAGIVARTVGNGDIRHQTNNAGQVQTYKDGRPKLVMVVPMQVQPSAEFPDGVAGWWVKGQARDELARAMAEAGAPAGPPEAGAAIRVTLVGQRPVPNMNPANQYRVDYVRPSGAAQAAPVAQVPAQAPAPQVEQMPVMSTATGQPVMHQQPIPQMPAPQAAPMPSNGFDPQQAPVPMPAPATAAPTGFTDEQAALFAKLTGGQA